MFYKSSCVSTSSLTFDLVSPFNFSHFSGCAEIFHCVLIYISMMINDIEHLCLYLLTPMSFFMWNISSNILPILKLGIFFSLLSCINSLCTLDLVLCQLYGLQIFSPLYGLAFHFLVMSLKKKKDLCWWSTIYQFLPFFPYIRNLCLSYITWVFLPCSLLGP